jgi:hypothetical protein
VQLIILPPDPETHGVQVAIIAWGRLHLVLVHHGGEMAVAAAVLGEAPGDVVSKLRRALLIERLEQPAQRVLAIAQIQADLRTSNLLGCLPNRDHEVRVLREKLEVIEQITMRLKRG